MIQRPKNVLVAMPEDEDQIYNMLTQGLHPENGMFTVAPEKVRHQIKVSTDQQGGVIGLIKQDKKIVASVGLELSQFWYSNQWFVSELWNFVLPEYRKSNYAKDLIDFSKWANESLNMMLVMGIMSTIRTEAKIKLYERRLGKMIGGFFVNGLPEETHFKQIEIAN